RECAGDCSYRWDFGDGEVSLEPNPTHLYREPGQYNAVGTYRDGSLDRNATCLKFVDVSAAPPSESPAAPSPPGVNHPPSISELAARVSYGQAEITAIVTDPDLGDTVTWSFEVVASPRGSSGFHFLVPSGSGGTLHTVFESFYSGAYTVRVHARDS